MQPMWPFELGEEEKPRKTFVPFNIYYTTNILPVLLGDKSGWYPNSNGALVQPQKREEHELHLKEQLREKIL